MAELADLSALAAASVCELAPYQPGKPPDELEREYGVSNAIKLASNENPRGPSPAVRAAMQKAAAEINRYPDGSGYYLHAELAKHLGVAPDQITLGNGSNDILVMLAEAFLTPTVAAVYDQHSFVIYRTAVQATGAISRVAPSVAAGQPGHLGHDLDAMLTRVDETTRMVFIANPNNPTGTWVGTDALHQFLTQLAPEVICVLDEAYFEYALADDYVNTVPWLAEFPNLVIVRTFSKAFGLAGLRVGYAVSSAPIAELLNRVRQPFNVNHIALAAAQAALQDPNWIAQTVKRNRRGMQLLQNGLQELGIEYVPSRGNFLLAHFGADAAACYEYLLQNGVIVRPVANYGLADYLRISIGTEAEMIVLLTQLADYQATLV